ncbi:MAG: tyrosine-type recombinase/integrase [Pseudomonadota bacterium]
MAVKQIKAPLPLFDNLDFLQNASKPAGIYAGEFLTDFEKTKAFLLSYRASLPTFNAYRREVERFLHWCNKVLLKSLVQLTREDFEDYIAFCQNPPKDWIGLQNVPKFIDQAGNRVANAEWRPFVATLPKSVIKLGKKPSIKDYRLSEKALQQIFSILSSFYNFLIQENYAKVNPVLLIKQKNTKYIRKHQTNAKVRRRSELQWAYVIETAEILANKDPEVHQRTLFIMNLLYGMYLRISELVASERWTPQMSDFARDYDGNWWFTTVGKGNKERQISVSDAMLAALKRYRQYLGVIPLPAPGEDLPLLNKVRGHGPVTSTRYIRKIVQFCFDQAVERLQQDNMPEDAQQLMAATVHWLRHTGISDDVKFRPREHVRDDAGHSSSAITDRYIDIGLRERHASARKKLIKPE